MPTLTIFTPTYNRAYSLHLCYESLCRQTCKDFCWLVIDDGSTDNTRELVEGWKKEGKVPITYFYQENQGMHGAHNAAYRLVDTELNTCIDSDDYMPPSAVQRIKDKWIELGSDVYGGIIGLDYDMNHRLIGGELKGDSIDVIDFALGKLDIAPGDKKYVCRTDLLKSTGSQQVFKGEKYFNPSWRIKEVARNHRQFLVINDELCTVDYQPTGLSKNKFRQYLNSPNGYMMIRKQILSFEGVPFKKKIRTLIHYDSEAILAGCFFRELFHSGQFLGMLICLPFGVGLMTYTKNKGKQNDR